MTEPVEVNTWDLRATGSTISSIGSALADVVRDKGDRLATADQGWSASVGLVAMGQQWHAALGSLATDVRGAGDNVIVAADRYRLADETARGRVYGS